MYITNKTERFSFKRGRDVRVSKLIKEDWPIVLPRVLSLYIMYSWCYGRNFGLKPLLKSYITKVLVYKGYLNKTIVYALLCVP